MDHGFRLRTFNLHRGLAVLLAGAAFFFCHCLAADEPPNVVLIIADDQRWDHFGFMGNERVHTPQLDALAEKSARWPNGYLPSSVCRPSLVTLLTGLYPHQHGVHFNHGPPGNAGYNKMRSVETYRETREREFKLISKVGCLPRWLSEGADYRCLQTGKFWEGHWRNAGFTEGMTTFEAPAGMAFGGVRTLASGVKVAHGNGDAGLWIGRRDLAPIRDFLDDCRSKTPQRPWLVWYAPYLPHEPHDAPERFRKLAAARPEVQAHERDYFASIAQFDATVGELVAMVEAQPSERSTLFIFVSDNGWAPKETRHPKTEKFPVDARSKRAPFDAGVRSPILVRWDGKVKPQTRTELVSSVDIVPTVLAAAGLRKPTASLPGIDLVESLASEPNNAGLRRRAVFGEIYPGDATTLNDPSRDVAYRFVRHDRWKMVVVDRPWRNYLKADALFDVVADPDERNNLIADRETSETVARLRKRLDQWWDGESVAQE